MVEGHVENHDRDATRPGEARGLAKCCSSMLEVSPSRENHGQPAFVAGVNNFLIPPRPARLDDRHDTGLGSLVYGIGKGEKGIRSEYATGRSVARLADRYVDRIHTAHLASTGAA